MAEKNLTLAQLRRAIRKDELSAVVAVGGTIRFVFRAGAGTLSGYLVNRSGVIKRFNDDAEGRYYLETIVRNNF